MNNGDRRVAITGIGAVTPVGNDVETTWRSLVEGRSGVGPITTFDTTNFDVKIAALVKDFDLDDYLSDRRLTRHLSTAGRYAVAAACQALDQAKVSEAAYEPWERGVAMGVSVGRPEMDDLAESLHRRHTTEGRELVRQAPSAVLRRNQNVTPKVLALLANCEGPMIAVSTACSASTHVIGEAVRRIQDGEAKLMLAGGADALTTWLDVLGFSLLGALNTTSNDAPARASRPFDAERAGFVLGEGAVVLVLEELDAARERGAPILAEVAGYGSSMNAYRITDAPPSGDGPDLSIAAALDDAGMRPDEVDYVVAHGTSTPGNDLCETNAIKTVFGEHARRLLISSPKSMTGHLTAASGALNVLVSTYAIREGVVPPTINYEHPDPKCDLDYVPNEARKQRVRAAVANAFAFGGTNGSLVVRGADGEEQG